jgi:hypothetical protein
VYDTTGQTLQKHYYVWQLLSRSQEMWWCAKVCRQTEKGYQTGREAQAGRQARQTEKGY